MTTQMPCSNGVSALFDGDGILLRRSVLWPGIKNHVQPPPPPSTTSILSSKTILPWNIAQIQLAFKDRHEIWVAVLGFELILELRNSWPSGIEYMQKWRKKLEIHYDGPPYSLIWPWNRSELRGKIAEVTFCIFIWPNRLAIAYCRSQEGYSRFSNDGTQRAKDQIA